MTLQQLNYLVALADAGSFVGAAVACHVTQPTLSMQVKKLEEEWGVLLFQRGPGTLEPTELGAEVVQRARRVLAEATALEQSVAHGRTRLDGTLRLGVIPTIAPYLIPKFIHTFAPAHPELHLHVQELHSEVIITRLHDGSLDMGLLALPLEEPELEELPLYREPLWLCAAESMPDVPLHAGGLLRLGGPLVLTSGNCLRSQVLQFCGAEAPAQAQVVYEGGSLEALMRLVAWGQGYTLVPELALPAQAPPGTVLRKLEEPVPVREVGLAVHPRFVRRVLAERLGQAIRAAVPTSMLTEKGKRLSWR